MNYIASHDKVSKSDIDGIATILWNQLAFHEQVPELCPEEMVPVVIDQINAGNPFCFNIQYVLFLIIIRGAWWAQSGEFQGSLQENCRKGSDPGAIPTGKVCHTNTNPGNWGSSVNTCKSWHKIFCQAYNIFKLFYREAIWCHLLPFSPKWSNTGSCNCKWHVQMCCKNRQWNLDCLGILHWFNHFSM